MHLITMAHLGEAQGVIEEFKLKRISSDLFKSSELSLLITGEGPFEAATKTAFILGQESYLSVINLGIAGSLGKDLSIGEIYPLRSIYLVQEDKPFFKSFKSHESGEDCLTSFERILDPQKAEKLKGLGHIVDREAWGVAMAAKTASIPFSSYKLISDVAGTLEACEAVKDKAQEFSRKLTLFLKELLNRKTSEVLPKRELPGFYFTFTTQHKLENLLSKLALKLNLSKEEALAKLPVCKLLNNERSPKERANLLLEEIEHQIDPVKRILKEKKEQWLKKIDDKDINIHVDPSWENPNVQFIFEAKNNEELQDRIKALEKIDLAPFTKLMNGEFHVE